jgi:hypothetical protein
MTGQSAAELTGRSFQAANQAITRLVAGRVLSQISVGRRNRAFEAVEVIDAFTALERQLASPRGNTPNIRPGSARSTPPLTHPHPSTVTQSHAAARLG